MGINSCCRASFGIYNTKEDVDALISALKEVNRLFNENKEKWFSLFYKLILFIIFSMNLNLNTSFLYAWYAVITIIILKTKFNKVNK